MGLHFYRSDVLNARGLYYAVHCFLLVIGVFLFPRYAGVGLPRLRGAAGPLRAYAALAALAAAAVALNYVHPLFTNPFAGQGPFFFTLGPLAWELLWSGLTFGFTFAAAGPRLGRAARHVLLAALTLGGAAWYLPTLRGMNPLDAAAFGAVALALSYLSLTLRQRTGSIWPGLAGHVVVKFLLTW